VLYWPQFFVLFVLFVVHSNSSVLSVSSCSNQDGELSNDGRGGDLLTSCSASIPGCNRGIIAGKRFSAATLRRGPKGWMTLFWVCLPKKWYLQKNVKELRGI
jgi:hypothetical protein